jgi:hypothetical protein
VIGGGGEERVEGKSEGAASPSAWTGASGEGCRSGEATSDMTTSSGRGGTERDGAGLGEGGWVDATEV